MLTAGSTGAIPWQSLRVVYRKQGRKKATTGRASRQTAIMHRLGAVTIDQHQGTII